MNKQELIANVAAESGATSSVVRKVLDAADTVVRNAISAGDHVFLFGLGKLYTKQRGPSKASNFGKSKPVIVPPRNIILFQPSVGLKKSANQK